MTPENKEIKNVGCNCSEIIELIKQRQGAILNLRFNTEPINKSRRKVIKHSVVCDKIMVGLKSFNKEEHQRNQKIYQLQITEIFKFTEIANTTNGSKHTVLMAV